jgi:EAL domain-containing protein (putative c-di-GMP-specific phosphodiesterase class I)
MDDVGEGLSTIEAIAVVRPEFIKAAKSLVVTADDAGSAAVIRGLVEVARSLGGEIIAEGLETREDCARMLGLGATLGQGWALGTPKRLRDVLAAGMVEDEEPDRAPAPGEAEPVPPALVPAPAPRLSSSLQALRSGRGTPTRRIAGWSPAPMRCSPPSTRPSARRWRLPDGPS